MEQHGNNHQQLVFAVIPARYDSTRLEGKLLLPLNGKPLILHTVEQTRKAANINRVIVATDDERILRIVEDDGHEAVLTSKNHQSGSDRIAEVAAALPENSIIVNVQGDEPTISPRTIEKAVAAILSDETADISTTCEKIEDYRDVLSSDVVKVVTDEQSFALYFSRSPIPFPREAVKKHGSLESALKNEPELISLYRKHTGLYVYRREFLLKFTGLEQTRWEKTEMLEQLRALENGARIKVVQVDESSIGVDTREDFERVKRILEKPALVYRRAEPDDAAAIAAVHVASWRKSFIGIAPQDFLDAMSPEKREQSFRQRMAEEKDYQIFVAEDAQQGIVGFADFGSSRAERFSFEAELYAIYLRREFQRRGIGEKLFRLCQSKMIEGGMNSMFLIALGASPYKSFYEKMGGTLIGEGTHSLGGHDYKTVIYGWDNLRETLKNG